MSESETLGEVAPLCGDLCKVKGWLLYNPMVSTLAVPRITAPHPTQMKSEPLGVGLGHPQVIAICSPV